jgi:hypothetical protein
MALQYKNQGFILNTTDLTTVLTIAADSRALVKSISVTNEHNSNNLVEMYLTDSSAGIDYEFFHELMTADETAQAAGQVLVLEESDGIKMQAATANVVKGVISYALINRSEENG